MFNLINDNDINCKHPFKKIYESKENDFKMQNRTTYKLPCIEIVCKKLNMEYSYFTVLELIHNIDWKSIHQAYWIDQLLFVLYLTYLDTIKTDFSPVQLLKWIQVAGVLN